MDIFRQLQQARSSTKVRTIAEQRVMDVANYIKQRLPFGVPTSDVETVALAGLAKGVGTVESIVLLSRKGHFGDAQTLLRSLMELAYWTSWMLLDADQQDRRLLMLAYDDALKSKNQVQYILQGDPGNILATAVPKLEANAERIAEVIKDKYPEIIDKSGKVQGLPSFLKVAQELNLGLTYSLVYTTLSASAHSDLRALAYHAIEEDGRFRFPVHAERQESTTPIFGTHTFLCLLAERVNLNLTNKLAPGFQERIEAEESVNIALARRANELRE